MLQAGAGTSQSSVSFTLARGQESEAQPRQESLGPPGLPPGQVILT